MFSFTTQIKLVLMQFDCNESSPVQVISVTAGSVHGCLSLNVAYVELLKHLAPVEGTCDHLKTNIL